MKSILSKDFKYVPSQLTDLRKTFARIKAEQKRNASEVHRKVSEIPTKRRQNG